MSKWNIVYNGFGSQVEGLGGIPPEQHRWKHVNVTSHRSTPVYSADGVSIETIRHTIVGTALISETTNALFRNALQNARQRLTRGPAFGKGLDIYIDDLDGDTELSSVTSSAGIPSETVSASVPSFGLGDTDHTVIYSGTEEDDYGLPSCEFNINEIKGALTAIVGFTITWHRYEPFTSAVATYDVLSHVWNQEHTIEEDGLTKITISGQLRVRNYDDSSGQGSATSGAQRGTDPDRYRNLVMPAVPQNFRVVNMKWATDQAGTTLNYTIILQEYARPLPSPAKKGSGSFSYRRSMDAGYMGIKTFQADLEGDAGASPAVLLASLLKCAASRIFFGGEGDDDQLDRLLSIEVTEHDIFTKRRIGLKIVAMGLQTDNPWGEGGIDPGFNLLASFFTEDLENSSKPNEYGDALIKSVKRQLFLPYLPSAQNTNYGEDNFPKALLADASAFSGITSSYQVNEIEDVETGEKMLGGEEEGADIEGTHHARQPYTLVNGRERLQIDNNHTVVSGCGLFSQDLVYQHGKPTVLLISEYELSRMNKPPTRFIMSPPANGLIVEESFNIERGQIDANNNREYRGVFRRVVRLIDAGDESGGFTVDNSITVPGWGTINTRAWWPVGGFLSQPVDARIEGDQQETGYITRNLFENDDEFENYWIGARPNQLGG